MYAEWSRVEKHHRRQSEKKSLDKKTGCVESKNCGVCSDWDGHRREKKKM